MASKTLETHPDLTRLRNEADAVIAGFNNEIANKGPESYFRMRSLLDRLNGLGGINLSNHEVEMLNRIVVRINEAAEQTESPYRLVKEENKFVMKNTKVEKKLIVKKEGKGILDNLRPRIHVESEKQSMGQKLKGLMQKDGEDPADDEDPEGAGDE